MKSIGRNDPCECQSGKKYKSCCQGKQKSEYLPQHFDFEWMKIRTAEAEFENIITQYVNSKFDESMKSAAWKEFSISSKFKLDETDYMLSFKLWSIYSWRIDLKDSLRNDTITMTELCRRECPRAFTKYHGQVLDAIAQSPFSFFIIQEVIVGKRLMLKDILLQKEITVKENLATDGLKKGVIIFGRPITVEGQSIFVGLFQYPINNRFFDKILAFREKWKATSRLTELTPIHLMESEKKLRELYFTIIKEASRPTKFSNTDGEALILNEIYYSFVCPLRTIFNSLAKMLSLDEKSHWEERVHDENGNFCEIILPWVKNRTSNMKGLGDRTSLGNFTITPDELMVFVNSNERADSAMKMISQFLGNNVILKTRKKINMASSTQVEKASKKRSQDNLGEVEESFKLDEEVTEYLMNYWKNWLDTQIPLLFNKTPREAVKSKLGREQLEALFLNMENNNMLNAQKGDFTNQVDTFFLKKELGML